MGENNQQPTYKRIGAPEIDGNPLAAHLPLAPDDDDAAFFALANAPAFNVEDRSLPSPVRRLRIKHLNRFFVPVSPVHRRALSSIVTSVHDGYIARNPMTPLGQRFLYGNTVASSYKPEITMVSGYSGMGKSTLIDRTLNYLSQSPVWNHSTFEGKAFPETQIVWLRRNVPEACTVRALCETFGEHTDAMLGQKLYTGVFSKLQRGGRNSYLSEIKKIIVSHHVGVLILDEFQNLSLMGLGANKIIALLINLRDELGLPIVIVGTYKALNLLKSDMSISRRLAEGGYFDIARPLGPDDENWQSLCWAAWEYQWVRKPIAFSDDVCSALYEVSQGITAIMLATLATSQIAAIESGVESVDANMIRKVFRERMEPLHQPIRALQSQDVKLMDLFDDLYKNNWPSGQPGPFQERIDLVSGGEFRGESYNSKSEKVDSRPPSGKRLGKQSPSISDAQLREIVVKRDGKGLSGLSGK